MTQVQPPCEGYVCKLQQSAKPAEHGGGRCAGESGAEPAHDIANCRGI